MQKPVHRSFGRTRVTVLGAALLAGTALPAAGLWAGSASATPVLGCPIHAGMTTCTFSYTGSAANWTVPAGITHLTVSADGGSGADAGSTPPVDNAANGPDTGGTGGNGGEYQAVLAHIPAGTVLSIFPGGAGNGTAGGVDAGSGGGSSTTAFSGNSGGGGGGASTVSVSGDRKGLLGGEQKSLLVVAGGGGGAGAGFSDDKRPLTGGTGGSAGAGNQVPLAPANGGNGGGSGGVNGADGTPATGGTEGGGGSTTSAAGGANGGRQGCSTSATDGGFLAGGASNSGDCELVGGGGGSGYYGGGGSAARAGAGGGSAFPAGVTTVDGIRVIPLADAKTHSGDGVVTITYQRVPTHLTAYIAFNIHQTFTVSGRLDGPSGPAVGQPLIFTTGRTFLCVAHTNRHGIGSCVLSYAKSVAIRQNAGRFAVFFPGSAGYLGSIALGQGIIHP